MVADSIGSVDLSPANYVVPQDVLRSVYESSVMTDPWYGKKESNDKTVELLLNALWGGGRVADSIMTDRAIRDHGAVEAHGVPRAIHGAAGLPGFLIADALTTAGSYGISRYLDKKSSPTMAKLWPILGSLIQGYVLARNMKTMREIER